MKIDKIIKIVAAVLIVVVAAVGIKAGVSKLVDSPKGVISDFESALNNKDFDAALECIDPTTQNLISAANSLFSSFTDIDIMDMLSGITAFAEISDDEDFDDFKNTKFKIDVNDIDKDGDTANVAVTFNVYNGNELVSSEDGTLKCVKIDGEWYIDFSSELGGLF